MEFVSFEIAKKLKDLGFDEPFVFFYREDDEDKCVHIVNISKPIIYCDKIDDEVIIAPTISQVLKWLRKEKKIYIEIFLYNGKYSYFVKSVTQMNEDDFSHKCLNEDTPDEEYDTPEQAAVAGIEYIFNNNLISYDTTNI